MSDFDVIKRGSIIAYRRDFALVEAASAACGVPAKWIQGGNNKGGVAQSAGTHDGLSVGDLSVKGISEKDAIKLVVELRKRGACAWLRNPDYGWPPRLSGPHIHFVVADGPHLAPAARQQVVAYKAGRNGLASRHADPFPRPAMTTFHIHAPAAKVNVSTARILANLHYGRDNHQVAALQKALGITQDGKFGDQTLAAVHHWQTQHGRKNSSFVGPSMAKELGLI